MGTLELAAVGLAGSSVGTALAIPMVWPRAPRPADVRFMGGWLLAGSAAAALISARVMGLVPVSALVEHAINVLGFCAYPLLYLCIRAQLTPPPSKRNLWWLWMPAGTYVAVLLVRSGLGGSTRVDFAWILPVLVTFTAICAVAVCRRPARPRTAVAPASFIVVFLGCLNVAQFVRMQFGHIAPIRALVPLVMSGGFVALVGILIWRTLDSRAEAPGEVASTTSPRYEKSGLDRAVALALLSTIHRVLTADRLFADADLTLGRLATAVGSTPHQVSEVLNRYLSVTFHDLVNRHRVADVKTQLCDPTSDRFTIEGIGSAAGFGSRSALYSAFRRLEGVTPAEFRTRARAQTATR